ncbi:Zn-dependent dipeptidase, microsomal dipeptidase [gamma proteobacterium HIMB55]|nr:Zn-dependent dipeptidase, microsomal dipeptidase [gamma proteobacterium HIMB55]
MAIIRSLLVITTLAMTALLAAIYTVGPGLLENAQNKVAGDKGAAPSPEALELHTSLDIADLHADTLLWYRSLIERSDRGQVDLPRMIDGNMAVQMLTTVTKSPSGQNYDSNSADAGDTITLLALVQRWPLATRDSLFARAVYQAGRLHKFAAESDDLEVVTSSEELKQVLKAREEGSQVVATLLGTEGSHALDGDLSNIQRLYDAGLRMMSLQHFFDNKLGGSLHGESNAGLTEFGRQAVLEMDALGIMIDVSHSSPQVVDDVLNLIDSPLIVSHTGFKGHCDRKRNISDALIARIAERGGLIGVGFWSEAVCGEDVAAIADAIAYGINNFGVDAVALGSDWDGAVTTPIDASDLAYLTSALINRGLTVEEIRAVMGGNTIRYFLEHLPKTD